MMKPSAPPSHRAKWFLRISLTLLALGWTASRLEWHSLRGALSHLPLGGLLAAALSWSITLALAALRWRLLLHAFGAQHPPAFRLLYRLCWEGHFFNTFLPANVAGDLLRASVTASAFERPSGAWLVVLLERASGLAALLGLAWLTARWHTSAEAPWGLGWLALSSHVGLAALALLPWFFERLLAPLASRPRGWLGRLPAPPHPLRHPGALLLAWAISWPAHLLAGAVAWVLLETAPFTATVGRVPLALASAYLPTVAGLGAREAAFTLLFEPLGVPTERAVAASLGLFAGQLAAAAMGGLVHVLAGRGQDRG